jgi:ferredoxin
MSMNNTVSVAISSKVCAACHEAKPVSEYHRDKSRRDGFLKYCKACARARRLEHRPHATVLDKETNRIWRQNHPDRIREYHRRTRERTWNSGGRERQYFANQKYRWGLTEAEFNAMREAQDGKCLLCGQVKKLCVDHSHLTGRIRGLLCIRCNAALGHLVGDDPDNVDRIREYLLLGVSD